MKCQHCQKEFDIWREGGVVFIPPGHYLSWEEATKDSKQSCPDCSSKDEETTP